MSPAFTGAQMMTSSNCVTKRVIRSIGSNKLAVPDCQYVCGLNLFPSVSFKLGICNDCKALVMRGGTKASSFNTSNLISHLRMNHAERYMAFVQPSNEKKQGQAAQKKNTRLESQPRKNKNTTRTTPGQKPSIGKSWSVSHWITSPFLSCKTPDSPNL